jgi:predicted  nucleic acid-binding Zn-ribbon protein
MAGNHNTFIVVPPDVTDPQQLRRFLSTLIEKLDVAFGVRANAEFTTVESLTAAQNDLTSVINSEVNTLNTSINSIANNVAANANNIQTNADNIQTNADNIQINSDDIDVLEALLEQSTIANSALSTVTASATYTQAEVQAIADQVISLQTKVNSILNSLRLSKTLTTP